MTPKQSVTVPLTDLPVSVFVSADLRTAFTTADINGHGGFQSLARMLSERLQTTSTLHLTNDEWARIIHYATNYGDGGFQARLRLLITHWVNQHYTRLTGASHATDHAGHRTTRPANQRTAAADGRAKRR